MPARRPLRGPTSASCRGLPPYADRRSPSSAAPVCGGPRHPTGARRPLLTPCGARPTRRRLMVPEASRTRCQRLLRGRAGSLHHLLAPPRRSTWVVSNLTIASHKFPSADRRSPPSVQEADAQALQERRSRGLRGPERWREFHHRDCAASRPHLAQGDRQVGGRDRPELARYQLAGGRLSDRTELRPSQRPDWSQSGTLRRTATRASRRTTCIGGRVPEPDAHGVERHGHDHPQAILYAARAALQPSVVLLRQRRRACGRNAPCTRTVPTALPRGLHRTFW